MLLNLFGHRFVSVTLQWRFVSVVLQYCNTSTTLIQWFQVILHRIRDTFFGNTCERNCRFVFW